MAKKYEITIAWGENDTHAASDGKWAEMENEPVTYTFDTERELSAFCAGVDSASGWQDYFVMDGDPLRKYSRSVRRRKGNTKVRHALEAAKCGSCGRFHSECVCE